jgi:predicted transcriptional regulator
MSTVSTQEDTNRLLRDIAEKLDAITRLLAVRVVDGDASLAAKAAVLKRCGIPVKEIAALLGTTPNTIAVGLAKAKKAASSRKKTPKS